MRKLQSFFSSLLLATTLCCLTSLSCLAQGTDPYEGIYVNNSSTPRIFIIKGGKYYHFIRKSDADLPMKYIYKLEDLYDYKVVDGKFTYKYTDTEFTMSDGAVVSLNMRGKESRKINSVKGVLEVNSWQAGPLLADLTSNHGLSKEEVKALVLREDLFEHFAPEEKVSFSVKDLTLSYQK